MNPVAIARRTSIALIAAVALGGAGLTAATPASAAPGYGHHHRHGHFHRHGYAYGGAGLIGGLALGALAAGAIATQPACYVAREPVTDAWGNVVRFRTVRVCE